MGPHQRRIIIAKGNLSPLMRITNIGHGYNLSVISPVLPNNLSVQKMRSACAKSAIENYNHNPGDVN